MATRFMTHTDCPAAPGPHEAAFAYDAVAAGYRTYADGDVADPFDFSGSHSFADREIWARLDGELVALRARGAQRVRILDAGCGQGTWLIRVALRARQLGFTQIEGHGFDISPEMIVLACAANLALSGRNIALHFSVADMTGAFETIRDGAYDISLCLYGVLNHLPVATHARIAGELARVTSGTLVVTVRTVGSLPTIYVDGIEQARFFHQDNEADRLEVDLVDGRHIGFGSHLFCSTELVGLFRPCTRVVEMVGLDLFHSRFASNRHWNPANVPGEGFEGALAQLEHSCAADPAFIDHAAHILLVATAVGGEPADGIR